MEMEMLNARNSPSEAMDGDGMWEDNEENKKQNQARRCWRGDVPCGLA
jgi:hypothetical protein